MKTIKAKFSSSCCTCGSIIHKGSTIVYDPARKQAHHEHCKPDHGPDKSASHEDWLCSDTAHEDACASACGYGL